MVDSKLSQIDLWKGISAASHSYNFPLREVGRGLNGRITVAKLNGILHGVSLAGLSGVKLTAPELGVLHVEALKSSLVSLSRSLLKSLRGVVLNPFR